MKENVYDQHRIIQMMINRNPIKEHIIVIVYDKICIVTPLYVMIAVFVVYYYVFLLNENKLNSSLSQYIIAFISTRIELRTAGV